MNNLIQITTDDTGEQTVNARGLHEFLESKQQFGNWIKNRIDQYGFVENLDYVKLNKKNKLSATGQTIIEYHISIDMAKELSMVERNEKGKQARQYFIECERRAKDPMVALNDPAAMRSLLLTCSEKVLSLEETVHDMTPKVAAFNRIATADGSLCITSAAKHLQVRPKELFQYLSEHKWIYRRTGNKSYLAYQNRLQQGVMEHKVTTHINGDGIERIYEQARVTPKGIARLSKIFERVLV